MTKIEYDSSMPKELAKALKPYFDELKFLIPTWCHTLVVTNLTDAERGQLAFATHMPDYRRGMVQFSLEWFEQDDDGRRKAVAHEILHLSIEPMRQILFRVIDVANKGDAFNDFVLEQWRIAYEGCVCDLTNSYLDTLK